MAIFNRKKARGANEIVETPQLTISDYQKKLSLYEESQYAIRSMEGQQLESMLYGVMALQERYADGSDEYKQCEHLSSLIVGKLEGLV